MRGEMTRELLGHFQVELPESVLEGRRDLVKVDREMGAEMGAKMGATMGATMGVSVGVARKTGRKFFEKSPAYSPYPSFKEPVCSEHERP
jgi:hypothetical protein